MFGLLLMVGASFAEEELAAPPTPDTAGWAAVSFPGTKTELEVAEPEIVEAPKRVHHVASVPSEPPSDEEVEALDSELSVLETMPY